MKLPITNLLQLYGRKLKLVKNNTVKTPQKGAYPSQPCAKPRLTVFLWGKQADIIPFMRPLPLGWTWWLPSQKPEHSILLLLVVLPDL